MILSRVFDINGGDNTSTELKDIGNHWAKDAIEKLAKAGGISGYEDSTFKPDNTIIRAEALHIILNVLNLNPQMKTLLDWLN